MKEHKLIKYETFQITGRGTVFALNMEENNMEEINKGDIVTIEDESKWTVVSIEGMRTLDKLSPKIGLIVKKIENESI